VSWLIDSCSRVQTIRYVFMMRVTQKTEKERNTLTQVYAFMKNGDETEVLCVAWGALGASYIELGITIHGMRLDSSLYS